MSPCIRDSTYETRWIVDRRMATVRGAHTFPNTRFPCPDHVVGDSVQAAERGELTVERASVLPLAYYTSTNQGEVNVVD